jgi:hypothetical protein
MLYNPDWEKSRIKDDSSLASLVLWLETKDPEESYTYNRSHDCMCAQYYKAKGYWMVHVGVTSFSHGLFGRGELPPHFNDIAIDTPHTFGAALERARDWQKHYQ